MNSDVSSLNAELASLNDRLFSALQSNPYLAGRRLNVESSDGEVWLRGRVENFFQKQMAQESIRHVDGVTAIRNELEVTWEA